MTALDSEHEGQTENYAPYKLYFRHLLRFLWSAANEKIPMLPNVISENREVQVWAERIHSVFLTRPVHQGHQAQPQAQLESSNKALEQVAFSITALQDHLSTHRTSSKEDSETGGLTKKFGPHLQQLFLNASAVEPFETAATVPNPLFEKFLAQKTLGSAKTFLRGHLKANPFIDFVPSPGLTTSAFTGNVLWDDSHTPRNYSIFYCGRAATMATTSSSYNDQALYLKEHIGKGISESEVKKILKQERVCPKDALEAIDQIQNFAVLNSFIFGASSKISLAIKSWISHLSRNKASYDSMQRADPSFLTQLLNCIDMVIYVHLASCQQQQIRTNMNDNCLDFRTDMNNVDCRQFACTLPPFLHLLALGGSSDDGVIEPKKGGGVPLKNLKLGHEDAELEAFNDHNKEKLTKNAKPNKTWLLKENKPFGSVFHKQIKTCPKQGRQFVCLKFWIKGTVTSMMIPRLASTLGSPNVVRIFSRGEGKVR